MNTQYEIQISLAGYAIVDTSTGEICGERRSITAAMRLVRQLNRGARTAARAERLADQPAFLRVQVG